MAEKTFKVKVEQKAERGVWLPIEILIEGVEESIKTTALANSGFLADTPYIAVPLGFAIMNGILPKEEHPLYEGLQLTGKKARIRVVTDDKVTEWIDAEILIHFRGPHIILSGDLVWDELGISDMVLDVV